MGKLEGEARGTSWLGLGTTEALHLAPGKPAPLKVQAEGRWAELGLGCPLVLVLLLERPWVLMLVLHIGSHQSTAAWVWRKEMAAEGEGVRMTSQKSAAIHGDAATWKPAQSGIATWPGTASGALSVEGCLLHDQRHPFRYVEETENAKPWR